MADIVCSANYLNIMISLDTMYIDLLKLSKAYCVQDKKTMIYKLKT